MKIEWSARLRIFLCASGALLALALVLQFAGLGLRAGVDFSGGTLIRCTVGEAFDAADAEDVLSAAGCGDFRLSLLEASALDEGEATADEADAADEDTDEEAAQENLRELWIRVKLSGGAEGEAAEALRARLEEELGAKDANFCVDSMDDMSASAQGGLARGLAAAGVAFLCALICVCARYGLRGGALALAALVHNLLMMCAVLTLLRATRALNRPFIAALFAVGGISIGGSASLLERIRERAKTSGANRAEIAQAAASGALRRVAPVALPALLALVLLFALGGHALRGFALALIAGGLASVCAQAMFTSQLWAAWTQRRGAKRG